MAAADDDAKLRGAQALVDGERRRGRGSRSNRASRYDSLKPETFDDGWETLGTLDAFKTT